MLFEKELSTLAREQSTLLNESRCQREAIRADVAEIREACAEWRGRFQAVEHLWPIVNAFLAGCTAQRDESAENGGCASAPTTR